MPVLDRVLSRIGLQRKGDGAPPIINYPLPRGNKPEIRISYASFGANNSALARSYEALATEGYQHNSDVYSCISLISQAGKQVQWDTAPGSQSVASIQLLDRSGGTTLIETWLSYLLLSGNAYLEKLRGLPGRGPQSGELKKLYCPRPDWVVALEDKTAMRAGNVGSWTVKGAAGAPYPVYRDDMIHSKLFNPLNPIYGMSPLESVLLLIDAENEGAAYMKRVLQRGFSPGWIEAAKDSLWDDVQVNQLKERVRQSKQKGEELFLENATWHEMGLRPVDSGVADQRVLSKRDIASVFHVPSQLIGDTTTQTYNTYSQARQALYMEAVLPLLEQFKNDWNRSVGDELGSPLAFDKDNFDAIAAARAEATDRVHKLWTSGLITQNEGRRDLSYDPVEGGDVFFAPASFLPLATDREEPAKPVAVPARRAG